MSPRSTAIFLLSCFATSILIVVFYLSPTSPFTPQEFSAGEYNSHDGSEDQGKDGWDDSSPGPETEESWFLETPSVIVPDIYLPFVLSYKRNTFSSDPERNHFLFYSFHVHFRFYESREDSPTDEDIHLIHTVRTTCYGGSASATIRIPSHKLSDPTTGRKIKVQVVRGEKISVDVRNIAPFSSEFEAKDEVLLVTKTISLQDSNHPLHKRRLRGKLNSNELWWRSQEIVIIDHEDVIIPRGTNLDVEEGCFVLLSPKRRIIVETDSTIQIKGSFQLPVILTAYNDSWGQIMFESGSKGEFSHLWLVKGGDDTSRKFGHSDSQPVLMANEDSEISMQHGGMMDGIGKGFGSKQARIRANDIVIARMDTGGEVQNTVLELIDSHVYEMPNGNGEIEDDDNDGMYFRSPHPSGDWSRVVRCFFALGEDDGIDQNGANLEIRDSFFVGFYHEGVATSGRDGGSVSLEDVIIQQCQQGLEIGYGHPTVDANRIILLNNEIGYRYGDEYPKRWAHDGSGSIEYSLSANSKKSNYWEEFKGMPRKGVSDRISSNCFIHDESQLSQFSMELPETGGCILRGLPSCQNDPQHSIGPNFCNHQYMSDQVPSLHTEIPSLKSFRSLNQALEALRINGLEEASNLKLASLYTSGCGISMSASLRVKNDFSVKVFIKSTLTDLSDCDGETYLREVKTSYLDLLLGRKLTPPTIGRVLTWQDMKDLFGNEAKEKTKTIMKHTKCVRMNEDDDDDDHVETIILPVSIQFWAEGVQKTKLPQPPLKHPSQQFLDYSLFSYIAACMRSFHNTFQLKGNFIFVDNDRCFSPESVFGTKSKHHQRRITYHKEIVYKHCGFSPDMVQRLRFESNRGMSLVDRFRRSLANDRLSDLLLTREPETFPEIERRIERFLNYYDQNCLCEDC
eukprot:gb/GECH01001383.1/.p1 GENE.gb/GECH01001383.1/~~gb/GECH01001383.1/.p1  ORF type:complete len:908 (+),score=173.20 gb/GECH01001383.1/:1-2724(+)